jgi:hypothetical protein
MMQAAAGPLMAAALRLVSSGAVTLRDLDKAPRALTNPWQLDEQGSLLAPVSELATMPPLAHA